jgi:uncharacterized protein
VSQPLHFAFFVCDLPSTRRFYGEVLGWSEFEPVAGRICAAGPPFILEPRIRYAGQSGEQATMFLLDPSGNALELKSFKHPEHVFTA